MNEEDHSRNVMTWVVLGGKTTRRKADVHTGRWFNIKQEMLSTDSEQSKSEQGFVISGDVLQLKISK